MGTGRKRMNLWGNGFSIIFIISPRFSQGKRWMIVDIAGVMDHFCDE